MDVNMDDPQWRITRGSVDVGTVQASFRQLVQDHAEDFVSPSLGVQDHTEDLFHLRLVFQDHTEDVFAGFFKI